MTTHLERNATRAALLILACLVGLPARAERTGSQSEAKQMSARAREALTQNRREEAEDLFKKAIAADPQLAEAYEGYSELLFVSGRHADGERLTRAAMKRLPDSDRLQAQLGLHLYKLGRLTEAHTLLRQAMQTQQDRYEVQAIAAQCCLRVKDYNCAAAGYRSYLAARPRQLAAKDAAFRVGLASAYLRLSRLVEAEKELRDILRSHSGYLPARIVLAEVLLEKGDFNGATAGYEQLRGAVSAQEFSRLRLLLARAYLGARRPEPALLEADAVLKGGSQVPEAFRVRGEAAQQLRRYDQALADFRKLAALTSNSAAARLRVARVLLLKGKAKEALDQVASELDSADAPAELVSVVVRAALRAGRKELALKAAQLILAAQRVDPDDLHQAGLALLASSKLEEAVPIFQKVLKREPGHLGALNELVRALCTLARRDSAAGNRTAAQEKLVQAARASPRSLPVRRNLALTYLAVGQHGKALAEAEFVLKRTPADAITNRLAGRALAGLRRYQEAQLRFDRAVQSLVVHGGLVLAQALVDAAVNLLKMGNAARSVPLLRRALEVLPTEPASAGLRLAAQRSLAAALIQSAGKNVAGDQKQAWADLSSAEQLLAPLAPAERLPLQAAGAFIALALGKPDEAKALAKAAGPRLGDVVLEPHRRIAGQLFEAYVDYLSTGAAGKTKAATRFSALAGRSSEPLRAGLLQLGHSAREQLADEQFRRGQFKAARTTLAEVGRSSGGQLSARQRYNLAVLDYLAGNKDSALEALSTLRRSLPQAHCALAIHHENSGSFEEAYKLLRACADAGGAAGSPAILRLLEARARLFGTAGAKP